MIWPNERLKESMFHEEFIEAMAGCGWPDWCYLPEKGHDFYTSLEDEHYVLAREGLPFLGRLTLPLHGGKAFWTVIVHAGLTEGQKAFVERIMAGLPEILMESAL